MTTQDLTDIAQALMTTRYPDTAERVVRAVYEGCGPTGNEGYVWEKAAELQERPFDWILVLDTTNLTRLLAYVQLLRLPATTRKDYPPELSDAIDHIMDVSRV